MQDETWSWFGRVLAVANTIYFSVNLFCFLIPMFLPRAFETYFNERAVYLANKKHATGDHRQKEEQARKAVQQQVQEPANTVQKKAL
jgi:hypothetical protein